MDPFHLQITKQHASSFSPPLILHSATNHRGQLGYGVWVGKDVTDEIYEGKKGESTHPSTHLLITLSTYPPTY